MNNDLSLICLFNFNFFPSPICVIFPDTVYLMLPCVKWNLPSQHTNVVSTSKCNVGWRSFYGQFWNKFATSRCDVNTTSYCDVKATLNEITLIDVETTFTKFETTLIDVKRRRNNVKRRRNNVKRRQSNVKVTSK